MTYYKLMESTTEPEPEPEPDPDLFDENPEGIGGDYKIINRASVTVDNDAKQITETMENPLVGVLTVGKQLLGTITAEDRTREFQFIITLTLQNGAPFDPEKLKITGNIEWQKNSAGAYTGTGSFTLIGGQSVTIGDIPYNTVYTVQEAEDAGFILYRATVNGREAENAAAGVAGGIDVETTDVIFYNAPSGYTPPVALPETGGAGTRVHRILGGFLTIGALLGLCTVKKKSSRGKACAARG